MQTEDANIIMRIGRRGSCSSRELFYFLPDFPSKSGSESIFTISEDTISGMTQYVYYLIKGLHLIELKYRELTKHENGFGSPSRTYHFINYLKGLNARRAEELSVWVANNGGNHYIWPSKSRIVSPIKDNDGDQADEVASAEVGTNKRKTTKKVEYFIKEYAERPATKEEFFQKQKEESIGGWALRRLLIKNKIFTQTQIDRLVDEKILSPRKYKAEIYFHPDEIRKAIEMLPTLKKKGVVKKQSQPLF